MSIDPSAPVSTPKLAQKPATAADLFAFLDGLGIAHPTVEHQALFTVAESRSHRDRSPGAHTKNLFLKDKKTRFFLIVALADAQIALNALHRQLGASGRFSFGSAEQMLEMLGVTPGSVTPFSAINDTDGRVTVILDREMMQHDVLNYHPLTNTMTTTIARDDLLKFLRATGHEPQIVQVSEGISAPPGL